MKINNRWKECEDKHINDPVVELIYESISLLDENIKLFAENKRLKERVKALERCSLPTHVETVVKIVKKQADMKSFEGF